MRKEEKIDFNKEIEKMFQTDELATYDIDYSIIEKRKPEWEMLARVAQSPVFVFDCFTHKFVYVSQLALEHFGLNPEAFLSEGHIPAY